MQTHPNATYILSVSSANILSNMNMSLERETENDSTSYPRIAFQNIIHASQKRKVFRKRYFYGTWHGDYGVITMEAKEEKESTPLRLFIPPRPFYHSHWENGYEGYVIEGTQYLYETFEIHRMYQYSSPSTVLEFNSSSHCIFINAGDVCAYSIEDVSSLFPLLQRGWPLSVLMRLLTLPDNDEWQEEGSMKEQSCWCR